MRPRSFEDHPIPSGSSSAAYALLQVKDELTRLPGVGAVQVFGAGEYSMRVWLDPNRLASRQLTTTDVVRAIAVGLAVSPLGAYYLGTPRMAGLVMR